jgi:hypothetical protein
MTHTRGLRTGSGLTFRADAADGVRSHGLRTGSFHIPIPPDATSADGVTH